MAHAAEPDEGDFRHALVHILDRCPGAVPKARCASVAAMNSSRSPSSTPEVSEVCTPVRRSFTIW